MAAFIFLTKIASNKHTMSFQFDLRGNLRPYKLIEADVQLINQEFCSTPARVSIFEQFELFLNQLKQLLPSTLEIWVDGSFITKKTNPADIDIVVMIDFQDFMKNKEALRKLFNDFGESPKKLVDAYPVITYPENHPNFTAYRSDYLYWIDLFGRTRPNRADKQFSKGLLKITL
jgi:hypothetical protein